MVERWIIAFLLAFATLSQAEETPPGHRPFLRIEAGMHAADAKRFAVSTDGKLMATGSHDKTARLWSLPDGKLLKTFRVPIGDGDDGKIYCVALSPDSRLLAVGGLMDSDGDDHIFLFDVQSGAMVRQLGGLPGVVFDVAFSPDGTLLAAGLGSSSGIRLWSVQNNFAAPPASDPGLEISINRIAFNRANRLVVTPVDGSIRLYDARGGERPELKLFRFDKSANGELFGVAFSPDGQTIATGHYDSPEIDLLDATTLARLPRGVDTSFAGEGELGSVAWSRDGEKLFAGGDYDDANGIHPVVVWDEAGKGAPRFLGKQEDTIFDVAGLPNGSIAWVAGGPYFGIHAPSGESLLRRGPPIADMRGKQEDRLLIAPNAASVWFGLGYGKEEPWIFDTATLRFAPPWFHPWTFIAADTGRLAVADWDDKKQPTLDGQPLEMKKYETSRSLAFAPDGKSFVLGTSWEIRRYSDTGEQSLWPGPIDTPGDAWGVVFSADGSLIVAALGDGTIRWYRASDGAELLAFFVHVPDKRWVAWTPTGYYASSAGGDELIGWHQNGKTWDDPVQWFPASHYRDRFERPDIVQLVLKTKDEAAAVRQADAARGTVAEPPADTRD